MRYCHQMLQYTLAYIFKEETEKVFYQLMFEEEQEQACSQPSEGGEGSYCLEI